MPRPAPTVDEGTTVHSKAHRPPTPAGSVSAVVGHIDMRSSGAPGLRERKKRQTRVDLIEAALTLSARQGYEATTVGQIADAAEVSARTFARYFPTKDGVILALLSDLTEAVNAELEQVRLEVAPLGALLTAQIAMLRRTAEDTGPLPPERLVSLLRIVGESPTLRLLAIEIRTRETANAVARRLNTTPEDRRVRLVSGVWAAIVGDALLTLSVQRSLLDDGAEIPGIFERLIIDNFEEFLGIADDVHKEFH